MSRTVQTSQNMCMDVVRNVLGCLHSTETALVSKEYADRARAKQTAAAVKLQQWYRRYKLDKVQNVVLYFILNVYV